MSDQNAKIDANFKPSLVAVAETSGERRQVKVDETTDYLLVSGTTTEEAPSTIVSGRKTVAVANTAVRLLAATTTCRRVIIQALRNNVGDIVVGDSAAVLTAGSESGIVLPQFNSISFDIDDVYKVYINGAAADGVSFIYLN